ncbi:hypothetical protein [uncultured Lamprocystis sp.]|uniref:hypothetical protein n=1 Tax=uncultured Lamprocystis sp. TaxID=543132 RepID=UPI0025F129CB|nr:hypothetical protein [uncultured Lamprocystis sp.]
MNRVQVVAYPDRRNGMRSCASDRKLAQVKRVLSYSRDGEGIESLDTDVVIRLDDDDFDGLSFGLALALADKRARFSMEAVSELTLCATGIINNKGKIGAVDRFPDKVALAITFLPKDSIFVYPQANRTDDANGLDRLAKGGVKLVCAEDLSYLVKLWEQPDRATNPESNRRWHPWGEFTFGVLVGVVIPVSIVFAYFTVFGS